MDLESTHGNNEGELNIFRSQSAQEPHSSTSIPLPPKNWITDISSDSSDVYSDYVNEDDGFRDMNVTSAADRSRTRTRRTIHKNRQYSIPLGIFWDIENCQIPRGCSAIDVVSAIRSKYLIGRREADFVVVCDVRKESSTRLQELNDAQVNLIHVCGTQKNAADEKLRQCMRRFAEMHSAPASLLLISGDINFAADLCDFRYRKNMEVILVHKQNTSSALIACVTSHYDYTQLLANLPKTDKSISVNDGESTNCEVLIDNLPLDVGWDRISRRLRRLGDNCGGKVISLTPPNAVMRFPTPDHSTRAIKRMDSEDVFGNKISVRGATVGDYSSDEGYVTAPQNNAAGNEMKVNVASSSYTTPQAPLPSTLPLFQQQPRKIRGVHGGSVSSGSSEGGVRTSSPWNSSGSSESEEGCELSVTNLPALEPNILQHKLRTIFSRCTPVLRVSIRAASDGPVATVTVRNETDARLAIAHLHRRRLDSSWGGRRLELAVGRGGPSVAADVMKTRLRRLLSDQPGAAMPLVRLRDAYASRHAAPLTASDLCRARDTVHVSEEPGRTVRLLDTSTMAPVEDDAPWRCIRHAPSHIQLDSARLLKPVCIRMELFSQQVYKLLADHSSMLPLLSFVECYETTFGPLVFDFELGVALELLLHNIEGVEIRDDPARHVGWVNTSNTLSDKEQNSRTPPALEPMLLLFERELIDLLRNEHRCSIQFCRFIPAYHHHFGRQCRVADYGFTRLPELLNAVKNTIIILGSGVSRVITLTISAQKRRWSADFTRISRNIRDPLVTMDDIPRLYRAVFGKNLQPADYGLCYLDELLTYTAHNIAVVLPGSGLALPQRELTSEEVSRQQTFSGELVELLRHTPTFSLEFSRFIPAYHAHFGRQLRVSHYGYVKLAELLSSLPHAVTLEGQDGALEKRVRLAPGPTLAAVADRLRPLVPITLSALSTAYAARYGATLDDPNEVAQAAGYIIRGGAVAAGEGIWAWWARVACSAACALLADRSVAPASTKEYLQSEFTRRGAGDVPITMLSLTGVVSVSECGVSLNNVWRVLMKLLASCRHYQTNLTPAMLSDLYLRTHRHKLPHTQVGFNSVISMMRAFPEIFLEDNDESFTIFPGLEIYVEYPKPDIDLLVDTPPGQKGSSVFCSPPASSLPRPPPNMLHPLRSRGRLAADFTNLKI